MNEPTPANNSNTMMITGIFIVAVIALVSVGAVAVQKKSEPAKAPATTQVSPESANTTTPTTMGNNTPTGISNVTEEYKNGTYTAEGDYTSPGGQEHVGVTLTLADGVITDVTFVPKATLPISQKMQTQFSEGYKPLVMGKNINEVKLDKVSGSSLTPKGFNDALEKIKVQASS